MLKNVQIKIVLIFAVTGILILSLLGAVVIFNLQKMDLSLVEHTVKTQQEWETIINTNIEQMKYIIMIAIITFAAICIVIGIFTSKYMISPITKLIQGAQNVTEKKDIEKNKKKNDVDEFVSAFEVINAELKENLNEVTRQKKQIEAILLHMTDGIIAFNKEGEIIHINPAAETLLQITETEKNFISIFSKLQIDVNLEKIIYLENWTSSEQRINVGEKYMNLFFAPFKDENDRPAGVIVLIQDITEHVKLDNMRKEFVANVSHELKTPITSIMGYADTLLESEYDKQMQDKFMKVIATEAKRMADLVTDLLTLSRYDTNRVKTDPVEFDLGELAKRCVEKLQIQIEQKKHNVECLVTANVPLVYADKFGIERVILNILSNSIKYTKQEGTIKIYVGFVYNDAYIKIIDNGIGIPQEDLPRIFERFYRVDKARTREMGGTGLGLSIAKEIMDRNHGSIDIKSVSGKGTEVVLRIPTKTN